jgi:hypothetical protein
MLTSLILAYFLLHGGASVGFTAQLERATKEIKQVVTVEATQKQALAVVDSATKVNKAFLDQQKTESEAISKVLADRHSTPAQVDSALRPLFSSDSVTAVKMVEASMRLRGLLTAAEWAKVFPASAAAN